MAETYITHAGVSCCRSKLDAMHAIRLQLTVSGGSLPDAAVKAPLKVFAANLQACFVLAYASCKTGAVQVLGGSYCTGLSSPPLTHMSCSKKARSTQSGSRQAQKAAPPPSHTRYRLPKARRL